MNTKVNKVKQETTYFLKCQGVNSYFFFFFGPKLVLHLEASFFLDILTNVLNRICSFYTKWQSSSLKIIFKKFVLKKCDNLELIQFICFLWTQTHIYIYAHTSSTNCNCWWSTLKQNLLWSNKLFTEKRVLKGYLLKDVENKLSAWVKVKSILTLKARLIKRL